jgi:hypothetical protein
MSRSLSKVNVQIRSEIFVTDNAGVAINGLVDGGFTKRLSKDGANDTTTVTVTEIANGRYTVTFTPTATGFYELDIIHATYNPFGWSESYDVTTDGILAASDITSSVPSAAAIASAVWSYVVGSVFTAKRYLKAIGAAVAGKTSGGPTGFTARDLEDTQDQVVGTADTSGNRTPTSYGN